MTVKIVDLLSEYRSLPLAAPAVKRSPDVCLLLPYALMRTLLKTRQQQPARPAICIQVSLLNACGLWRCTMQERVRGKAREVTLKCCDARNIHVSVWRLAYWVFSFHCRQPFTLRLCRGRITHNMPTSLSNNRHFLSGKSDCSVPSTSCHLVERAVGS
jgi:hypothetical protein